MKIFFICASSILLATSSLQAWTISILDPNSLYSEKTTMPDGKNMSSFMSLLKGQEGTAITTGSLANYEVGTSDAVIVNLISNGPIYTDAELAVLTNLINSGTRVLLIGENDSWESSNAQLATLLGGGTFLGNGSSYQIATKPTSATGQLILQGVGTIYFGTPGKAPIGAGDGEWLSDSGAISLWGAEDNILLSMDINMFENDKLVYNAQLLQNIANFLNGATPIPEPSTWAMMIGGASLGLVALSRRRRKG